MPAVAGADRWERLRREYPPILDTAQVAELLGLNVRTVLNMAQDRRLVASRIAGTRKFLYPLEDVIAVLDAGLNVPVSERRSGHEKPAPT